MFQGAQRPSMLGTSGIILRLIFKKQNLICCLATCANALAVPVSCCFFVVVDKSASRFPFVIDMRPEDLSGISVGTVEVFNLKALRNGHVGRLGHVFGTSSQLEG